MEDYNVNMVAEQPWEETLEFLTSDMDPESIDICVLTDRYRTYIKELQKNDLEVSAKAIRVCAALLNMKAQALQLEEEEEPEEENPMDFEEEELIEEEEMIEDDEPDLVVGPDLEMPVKQKPRRRVQLDELKASLKDAMDVKEQREQREQERMEMDQQFEVEEEDLQSKLNSLYGRIKNFVSSPTDNVDFTEIVEQDDSQERIEKFKHVLNLENDEKVDLIQEEFLGNLRIKPKEQPS
ncbi:segregation/condensation protein A [Candidatus Nanosalina sp. VS9-1]|uniref:segregation/condensation protein A n=1 Tax=Candidatus Nanosalina sp. VS9-1 TaxID=3388566 RepID=UPI0039E065BC